MSKLFDGAPQDHSAPVVPETAEAILAQVTEKFKNDKGELDVVALAKGKIEADAFIERLKSEQSELRQDLNSRTALEELLNDLKTARQPASNGQPQAPVNEPEPRDKAALSKEDLVALVREELSTTQKQLHAQRNIDFVEAELTKQWGTSVRSKLEAKARELDVSLDFLKNIAAQRPKAFLEMVGAKVVQQVDTSGITPPPSRQNVPLREPTKDRTMSYYRELRKSNPTLYWSPQTQLQEMNDAKRLGEAFYDN